MNDSLGDRMKEYEKVSQLQLIRRMPAILRLDGRAFHTFTKGMSKPFDNTMDMLMHATTLAVFEGVQTSILAYTQSDEISILLKDYTKLETQAWFGGNIQKIVSIASAICSVGFNNYARQIVDAGPDYFKQVFDARVFNIPKEDVVNYFIWRQKDATRNSINATGQANFSHSDLLGKSQNDVLDMLHNKGINWNETPTKYKRGFCYTPTLFWSMPENAPGNPSYGWQNYKFDDEIPIFTENREYISRLLE